MNRRKIILIIFISLIIIFINCISYAKSGKVSTETLRIRENPSTDSRVIDMANQDDSIEIIGEEGTWYKVSYNGKEGYASKDYITVNENDTSSSDETSMDEPRNTGTEVTPEEPVETVVEENNTVEENNISENVERELTDTINTKTSGYLTPNITSIKLMEIEQGKKVEIIRTILNWSKVRVDDKEVWVANEFLYNEVTVEQPEETPAEEPEQPEETTETDNGETAINQEGYISANSSVNLREGPSTDTKSLDQIKKNEVVTVISEVDGWYKISYNSKEGYVLKTLVTLGQPEEATSSRSLEEPRNDVAEKSQSIVETAKLYLGGKYTSGGSSPSTGFDCSGFVQFIYKTHGISIPRSASAQYNSGTKINKSEMQVGDLVFFSENAGGKSVSHVGIYIGNGQFIHAANAKRGIVINSLDGKDNYGYDNKFIGAARY